MTGIIFIVFASLTWALDTLFRYPLVESGLSSMTIVFYEHIFLSFIFGWSLIPALKKVGDLRVADIFCFKGVGCIGSGLATVAFTQSFNYLNPSLAILFQKFQPIIAILLANAILKEPIQKKFIFWALICMVGGLLISAPDIERFIELIQKDFKLVISDDAMKGYALVLISILGWGSATVFGKKLSVSGFDTKSILSGRFLLGLLALIPFMNLKWDESMLLSQWEDYLRIIIMVLLSGVLGMWLYYRGLQRLDAKVAAIAEMFFPFFAIVVNWVFLGKQLSELQLVGGAILVIGSLVIQIKKY